MVNFKMQSGREDTLEERYAIKLCFKLGKNPTKTYGIIQIAFGASCMRFKEGRELMRRVRGVRKSIHQSRLDKWLGL